MTELNEVRPDAARTVTRLLIVGAPLSPVGGTVRRLRLWFESLPHGMQVRLLCSGVADFRDKLQPPDGVVEICETAALARISRMLIAPAAAAVRQNIVEFAPDVVVSISPWTHLSCGIAARSIRRGPRPRIGAYLAGDPVPVLWNASIWRRRLYRKLFVLGAALADRVVVLSPTMRNALITEYTLDSDLIRSVPIGVLSQEPQKNRLRTSDGAGAVTFMVMSRLVENKGVDLTLQAFAAVRAKHPNVRLIVCGDGPSRDKLVRIATRLGIADDVTFTGWIDEPVTALATADCLVLSSFGEGTPRSILEAASVGVPSIATQVGGVADVVDHGETGWLVPPGDVGSLVLAMGSAAADKVKLRCVGANARRFVRLRHSIDGELARVVEAIGLPASPYPL